MKPTTLLASFAISLAILALSACSTTQPVSPSTPGLQPAIAQQAGPLPAGLGIQLHLWDIDNPGFSKLNQIRPGLVRLDFAWDWIEKSPGSYDFSLHDRNLRAAAGWDAWTIMIISYGNPLYPGSQPPTDPAAAAALGRCAEAAARRWQGKKVIYELWNEPNKPPYWSSTTGGTVDAYGTWAVQVAQAIRQGDSQACIVGPALAGVDSDWVVGLTKTPVYPYLGAVTVHPYRGDSIPETAISDIKSSRFQAEGFWRGWSSEYPLSIRRGQELVPVAPGEWGYSLEYVDEVAQAAFLIRSWLGFKAKGSPFVLWYDWQDAEYGMIDDAGNPRLAFTAAKVVTRETRGFQPAKTYRTGSTWMLKMVDASGRIKVAAWSTSGAYAAPWPAELRGVFSTGVDIFGRLTTTDGQTCWVTETPVIWGGSPEPAAKRKRR